MINKYNCEFSALIYPAGPSSAQPRARMSAEELNLQAQVEAILGTLVRAASVELIKLFESRFRASATGPDATQRDGGEEGFEVTDSLSSGGAKRSVGVQVEAPDCVGMSGLPVLSGGSRRLDSMNPGAPELQLRVGSFALIPAKS